MLGLALGLVRVKVRASQDWLRLGLVLVLQSQLPWDKIVGNYSTDLVTSVITCKTAFFLLNSYVLLKQVHLFVLACIWDVAVLLLMVFYPWRLFCDHHL